MDANIPYPPEPQRATPFAAAPVAPPVAHPADFTAAPAQFAPPAPADFTAAPPPAPAPTPHPAFANTPASVQFAPPSLPSDATSNTLADISAPAAPDSWMTAAAPAAPTPVPGWVAPESEGKKSNKVAFIVVGAVVVLVVLPILAIAALTFLGSQVEDSFIPVPIDSSESAAAFEPTPVPEEFTTSVEEPVELVDSPTFAGTQYGNFAFDADPSWIDPSDFGGIDGVSAAKSWVSAEGFDVVAWSLPDDGSGTTLEQHMTQEAELNEFTVDEFRELTVGDTPLTTAFLSHPESPDRTLMFAHEGEGGFAVVSLWASSPEELERLTRTYSAALTSIRYVEGEPVTAAAGGPGAFVAGESFLTPNGQTSMMTASDWTAPSFGFSQGGLEVSTFELPNLSSGSLNASLIVIGNRDFSSNGVTIERVIESEARRSGLVVDESRTEVGPDGETIGITTMSGTFAGVDVGALLIVHQSTSGSSRTMFLAPIDRLDEGTLLYQEHMETIRHLG